MIDEPLDTGATAWPLHADASSRPAPRAIEDGAGAARRRLAIIFVAAISVHVGGLVALDLVERFSGFEAAGSGVEIPVEVVGEAEAGKQSPEGGAAASAEKPPAIQEARREAGDAERAEQQPQEQRSAPPKGVIVERPKETDLQQEARKRGEADPDKRSRDNGNPFGGLAPIAKETEQRAPAFVAPQAFFEQARPKPAPDATNDNYRAKVLGKVAESMIDPERPRPKALAIVGFTVDDSGALKSAWLARPSGYPDLDAEAIEMVKRAAPFPLPPQNADHNFAAAIAFGGE
jgi:periplasmic protein TonB